MKRIKGTWLSWAIFFLVALAAPVPGAIVHVKHDATGANTGANWANAHVDLQSALAAAVSGDEIWVAVGTYKPTPGTDRAVSFQMKS